MAVDRQRRRVCICVRPPLQGQHPLGLCGCSLFSHQALRCFPTLVFAKLRTCCTVAIAFLWERPLARWPAASSGLRWQLAMFRAPLPAAWRTPRLGLATQGFLPAAQSLRWQRRACSAPRCRQVGAPCSWPTAQGLGLQRRHWAGSGAHVSRPAASRLERHVWAHRARFGLAAWRMLCRPLPAGFGRPTAQRWGW